MSVRMLSRPSSTNGSGSNVGIQISIPPPAPIINPTSSSSPSFAPSSSSGSPPSPFSFPPPPDLPFQQQRIAPSSTSPSPAAGASTCVLNLSPSVQASSSSSSSVPVASSGSGTTCVPASPLSSVGSGGVVVVGVIGRVEHEVSQFLDRLLDSQVFGIKRRGLEAWNESERNGLVFSDSVQKRENEREAASHQPSSKDPLEDGETSEVESRAEDGSIGAPDFLNHKNGPKTRGVKTEKFQVKDRDKSSKHQERRVNQKLAEEVAGNGSNGREKESRSDDKTTGNEVAEVGEGMRDGYKSSTPYFSKFKHYHDEERGMVFVQFSWGSLALDILREEACRPLIAGDGLSAVLEQHEADGMRGLLFMFSVCHIILLVQDGAHFDPQFLHVLRMLQAAKHSLAPFIKAQVLPGLLPPPSSLTRPSPLKPLSLATNSMPSGRTAVVGRSSSTIALMSGSTPVLLPGQCTPVVLFVYLDDLTEPSVAGVPYSGTSRAEDTSEVATSSVPQPGPSTQSVNASYLSRQSAYPKPALSTVVRPVNKSEAGFRRKLQSSMEAQIRFLLKKCRTVAGSGESGPSAVGGGPGMGPRGPGGSTNTFQGVGGGGALFLLDPSRAVVLLDRSGNHLIDALDAATDAMEAMLLGREGAEDTSEGGLNAGVAGEDIQAVKDFLWRQVDILRGKGGISSSAGGGSAGVGMVAAAAAAAAASAASGGSSGTSKPVCNPPELPTISSWLSACRVLAEALFVKSKEENGVSTGQRASEGNRNVMRKGSMEISRILVNTGSLVRSKCTIDATIACLDSGVNMDQKFSAAWCKRVLPSAYEVYMKGLPPCYPTSLHKSQLEKALGVFRSMVRGPAVPVYAEKLRVDCEAVWHSGRRLCDAVSLTGKPCIHQVHEVCSSVPNCSSMGRRRGNNNEIQETGKTATGKHISKPHSSGVVFLHACACGRSRKLRKDPFDFESANVRFFKFPNCEDMLPSLVIPSPGGSPSTGGSPWSLVCLGNSNYYQPSRGLLQSGFCSKQNFLSSWDIPVVYRKAEVHEEILPPSPPKEQISESLISGSGKAAADGKVVIKSLLPRGGQSTIDSKTATVSLYSKVAEKGYVDTSRPNSTRVTGLPDTPRGFTEIATKTNYGGESAFPPLPQKQDKPPPPARAPKHTSSKKEASQFMREQRDETSKPPVHEIADKMQDRTDTTAVREEESEQNGQRDSSLTPKVTLNSVTEHVRVCIGFEHECPRGHRFLLSSSDSEISVPSLPTGLPVTGKQEHANSGRLGRNKYSDQNVVTATDSMRTATAQDVHPLRRQESNGKTLGLISNLNSKWGRKDTKIPEEMQYWSVQEGRGEGYSLLNSNLPIYMNCPHCKTSEDDTKANTYKGMVLGGTISQLQRIFLVTPPLPILLATRPVVEFEDSSKPVKSLVEFNPGSEVVLPPDSFLSLQLPFVYYTQMDGIPIKPLLANQQKPQQTAWLLKGTALYVKSKDGVNGPTDG